MPPHDARDGGAIALSLFERCAAAMSENALIRRESSRDKEYHFQEWVGERLAETGANFDAIGRNSYPDFGIVGAEVGFEVKGLAYPGRDASYDANSHVPTGHYNGREIYHVFGRYPRDPDGQEYPALDLVVCHGDLLNADHKYVHKNKHVSGFGSYGDIKIIDRKMYVVPTPFALMEGVAHHATLITPEEYGDARGLVASGNLARTEVDNVIAGYSFDAKTSEITARTAHNRYAGKIHRFRAWRANRGGPAVSMRAHAEGTA